MCGANDDAELEKPVEENLNSQDRLTAHMRIAVIDTNMGLEVPTHFDSILNLKQYSF